MKKLIALSLLLSAMSANASVDYLKQSLLSTLSLIVQGHSLEEVEALQANVIHSEVETLALLHDEIRGHEEILEFGCHLHGSQMACHPHGHSHLKNVSFSDFLESMRVSFTNLEVSFRARGISNAVLEEAKFWKTGHSHLLGGDEVFGKFTYEVNGVDETIYSECHRHSASDPIDCHFSFQGEEGPDLGGGHQH